MKITNIRKLKNDIWGYCFIAPALVLFILFTLIPIGMSIALSFTNYGGITYSTMSWVGFKNYSFIFKSNKIFWSSMKTIGIYVAATVPVCLSLSMILALVIKKNIPGTKIFRGLFYIPGITSSVATSTVFKYLFNGGGIFNNLIKSFNSTFGSNLGFITLAKPNTALFILIFMAWWGTLGGNMVLFLASMQGIPSTVYEAAKIDGASGKRTFFQITLPLMRPAIYFALTLALINAPQMFEPILIMDVGRVIATPVYIVYDNAVAGRGVGLGTAQAVIMFVFIMVITFVMQRINRDSKV